MLVRIERGPSDQKVGGLLSRETITVFCVKLRIQFTPEEMETIKRAGIEELIVMERKPGPLDNPEDFEKYIGPLVLKNLVQLFDLPDGGYIGCYADQPTAKNVVIELKEALTLLKEVLDDNVDTTTHVEEFEL